MSYKYYQQQTKPIACFLMGDTSSPYKDISGNNQVANTKAGSTLAPLSVPLVAGAGNSNLFDASHVGEFTANFFQQGMEKRNWAMAMWATPIQYSTGFAATYTNLITNPTFRSAFTAWTQYGQCTAVRNAGTGYDGAGYCTITATAVTADTGASFFSLPNTIGTVYSASWQVRNSGGSSLNVRSRWNGGTSNYTVPNDGAWHMFTVTYTAGVTSNFFRPTEFYTGGSLNGTLDLDAVCLVANATPVAYFDGNSPGASWNGTVDASTSTVLGSTNTFSLLSHTGQTDGITFSGTVMRFSTDYLASGSAAVTYDIQTARKVFIVVQHSLASNELWVDGQLVGQVAVTNAQQNDTFVATTNKLYCGTTVSGQKASVQAIGFYNSLTSEDIATLYSYGNNVVPQTKIAPQFNGDTYNLNRDFGSYFIDQTWETTEDFDIGETNTIGVAGDQLTPILNGSLTSVAGNWKIGLPLDNSGASSIYGVALQWSGSGMTVDVSLDGTTWTPAVNNQLVSIIPSGYNPTGQDMHIRVSFAGGVVNDPGYLDSIRAVGFLDNTFANGMGRPVTIASPAILRDDYEPIFYRDDNGVRLNSTTLTVGADASSEPKTARTVEIWIKILNGTPTFNVAGTVYRNGAADASLPVGEWMLLHRVAAADIVGSITINGDVIVGQVSIYPTALTAGNIAYIWQSYTGKPIVAVNDPGAIAITEPATPVLIYAHDWSVDGGGG